MTSYNVQVIPYDPQWPKMFQLEAELILQALGNNCTVVHHIGSTSIVGISAKPIIDILPVVIDIRAVDNSVKAMESIGYEAKGEYGIAFRRYFHKDQGLRTHNVHVYQEGDPEISRYLKFRDWMRLHKEDAEQYSKLKEELAIKFPQDILAYCNGKDAFVASIDAKNGFDGWRMVQALTDREWLTIRDLRQKYFYKMIEDPFTRTFKHKDHIHFVFYKNASIIGYAHLQLWQAGRVALRMIVIDENYRSQGYESQFLKLCERWLDHQGLNVLVTQSSPQDYVFYKLNGYVEMPFNDPDGYEAGPQDIPIGKFLAT
jgi:GrpB-like predicted nucleotidyltransferase (UPF0157 family)/GNAT superfamily N-acetyltransferase